MASEQIHLICHEGKTIDRVDDSWDHRLVENVTDDNLSCTSQSSDKLYKMLVLY